MRGSPRPAGGEALPVLAALALVIAPVWLGGSVFSPSFPPGGRTRLPLEWTGGDRSAGQVTAAAPRIDAQRAPWYAWTLLEGIGEARARRIVEQREKQGGFRALEDLKSVPGMPQGWVEKAAPYLEFGGGFSGPAKTRERRRQEGAE
ncbi:MAG: helix-hairpin-helix domain-containing protein [Planctomycetes bacterium]|nr:helix-hairpin-helix domain-containing protein [Planctomycetota bacterium]